MDKVDQLAEQINRLVAAQEQERSRSSKLLHFGEKLLVPIMLGVLAYVANDASNRISERQLQLAQEQARLSDNRQRDEIRRKNIELLLSRPNATAEEQRSVTVFASYLDPDLVAVVNAVLSTPSPTEVFDGSGGEKPTYVTKQASATAVAGPTGVSGRWQTYPVCVDVPKGGVVDRTSVQTRVVSGVGPGTWGDWQGPVRFSGADLEKPSRVCRDFAHQIHDQARVLEISVAYDIREFSEG